MFLQHCKVRAALVHVRQNENKKKHNSLILTLAPAVPIQPRRFRTLSNTMQPCRKRKEQSVQDEQ